MLFTVGEREFHELVMEKEDIIAARGGYAAPMMVAMSAKWMGQLDQPASLILVYLMSRTFGSGKQAERISIREFVEGVRADDRSLVFAALPMSVNTLRKHLKNLCDDDLITIYSARSMLEGTESQARMFEINCKKVLDVPVLEVGRDEFLLQIEAAVQAEKGGNTRQKLLSASL